MYILGVHDGHNASVCLLKDGKVLFLAQEERFVRRKNFWGMPRMAVEDVLRRAGICFEEIDRIVFATRIGRATTEIKFGQFIGMMRVAIENTTFNVLFGKSSLVELILGFIRVKVYRIFGGVLYSRYTKRSQKGRIKIFEKYFPDSINITKEFMDHHNCHFATGFFGGKHDNEETLVFTSDGNGDRLSGSVSLFNGNKVETLERVSEGNSIGMLWAIITELMGFVPLEHEYKLMGMAPYADPEKSRLVAEKLKSVYSVRDGLIVCDLNFQCLPIDITELASYLEDLIKYQRFDVICGGLQLFTEEILVDWVEYWIKKTGVRKISCSGGTFMNVKANLRLMESELVDEIFVFPSCGDETNAIGACYQSWMNEKGEYPQPLDDFCLGREWDEDEIRIAIDAFDTDGIEVTHLKNIEHRVAELLAEGEIVARFKGPEEFGARALGNRSILANPSKWSAVSEINDMIKQRDFWMPFACSILEEDKVRYLIDPGKNEGSYMIMAFQGGNEIEAIIAGTHPRDKTVRPQVISQHRSPEYHALISRFKELTGIGAVLNTSFNLHGWPLVHTPENALTVLYKSGLKNLAIGNYLLQKKEHLDYKEKTR